MAKTKISEFDTNPALNTDIDSINIAEGCAPSGINNAIRELMSQLKNQQDGSSLDTFTVGNTLTINAANSLRLADTDSSNYVGLKAPATIVDNYTLTLPSTAGTNNQTIITNGSNALSFTSTLTGISLSGGTLANGYTETVYSLTGTAFNAANGSIQTKTLSGNVTFTDSVSAGQSFTLMLNGGSSYTVTWPTITWVTSAGNYAPVLTANDAFVFWKISTTLYGAYVGSYA